MKLSIITPSLNQSEWLKLCVASVADQEGVDVEHIVQDACSTDSTHDWLKDDSRVIAVIEKDRGMYDAVNRGFNKASGDVFAYLNCDEQYLPNALQKVADFFDTHKDVDVLFGDSIVVDADGNFICFRGALTPTVSHSYVSNNISFFTCSTFLRKRVFEDMKCHFDTAWRDLGDINWGLQLLNKHVSMKAGGFFTSVFTDTGENMNLGENAMKEKRTMFHSAPWYARRLYPLVIAKYRLRKLISGAYRRSLSEYKIYTKANPETRATFEVDHPSFRWHGRTNTPVCK